MGAQRRRRAAAAGTAALCILLFFIIDLNDALGMVAADIISLVRYKLP